MSSMRSTFTHRRTCAMAVVAGVLLTLAVGSSASRPASGEWRLACRAESRLTADLDSSGTEDREPAGLDTYRTAAGALPFPWNVAVVVAIDALAEEIRTHPAGRSGCS